jgi:hypothetical protein
MRIYRDCFGFTIPVSTQFQRTMTPFALLKTGWIQNKH